MKQVWQAESNPSQQWLIQEANRVLDRIEIALNYLVGSIKAKKENKDAN